MSNKKIRICIDFDGVLCNSPPVWGKWLTDERPVPGAMDFLFRQSNYYLLDVFSTRSGDPAKKLDMIAWLKREMLRYLNGDEDLANEILMGVNFPDTKPIATMYIDDRAYHFDGTFPDEETIEGFKPWNR